MFSKGKCAMKKDLGPTKERPYKNQWAWFIGLWLLGFMTTFTVTYTLKYTIKALFFS